MTGAEPTIVLAVLAGSLILFVTDALRYEVVAVLVALVLVVTGCLTVEQGFAGFSAPATLMVASMYVFAEAVTRSGVGQSIGQGLILRGPRSEAWLALKIVVVGGLLSSVLSDTAVTACLLPVVTSVARESRVSSSRLLIPLAFSTLLGGKVTVLGTSTNIAINGVLSAQGAAPFELFEFALPGLAMVALGMAYFFGPGRLLLPRSDVDESLSEHYQVPKFVTEVLVEPSSTLINRPVVDLPLFAQYGITVIGIVRAGGEAPILAPGPYNRIRSSDTLILQGEPEAILRLRTDLGLRQRSSVQAGDMRLDSEDVRLIEAVVPGESRLVGRTLAEADFREQSALNVLAISKHGDVRPGQIAHTRLEVGDTLLIQGHERDLERARRGRELLLLGELQRKTIGRGALITVVTLLGLLAVSAAGWLPLAVAALTGAMVLVLTKTVRAEDALRSIDWSVILLLGGMLALGEAFTRHGLAASVARGALSLGSEGLHPMVVVVVLMAVTMGLSQIVANVSAGVIMTPVALVVAEQLGYESRPFLLAVVFGASSAFLTPVGHQANAMVAGPGNYKFKDFLRVGLPLSVAVVVLFAALIAALYPPVRLAAITAG